MAPPGWGRTAFRAAVVVAAILGLALVIRALRPAAPATPPNRTPTHAAALTFGDALAAADRAVAGAQTVASAHPDEWLQQERLAVALIARARLTGDFDDYAAAQAALDRGFAHAPAGSGPHLTQAALDLSMHRLAHAESMLDAIDRYAVPVDAGDRDEARGMRGDIAFYRGRYAEAAGLYGTGDAGPFRRAVYAGRTGDFDGALRLLDDQERSLKFPTALALANLAIQRGELELQRGRRDAASAHFTRAERLFPGFWLAQAHSAQMLALQGRQAEAIARFQALATERSAPEAMDALAAIYRAKGDFANAAVWSGRAGEIWSRRLAQIPEAAWGHAVEHELAFGEPARALDLARRDHAARPYGATAVSLAWALLANARPAEALAVLKPVNDGPYVSAEAHAAAAQAQALLGQSDAAETERAAALAINAHALDRDAALVWFGH